MKILTVKELVLGNQWVSFHQYSNGNLWYKHETGFLFPIPIDDTGDAVFHDVEKAVLCMRWIRKQIEMLNTVHTELLATKGPV